MTINNQLLSTLSSQAKASPRLRQNYDLRNTPEDNSQRMLNALEPGTIMPIHRHRNSSESVVIVRGSLIERFYDDEGNISEEVLMRPEGENLLPKWRRVGGIVLSVWSLGLFFLRVKMACTFL